MRMMSRACWKPRPERLARSNASPSSRVAGGSSSSMTPCRDRLKCMFSQVRHSGAAIGKLARWRCSAVSASRNASAASRMGRVLTPVACSGNSPGRRSGPDLMPSSGLASNACHESISSRRGGGISVTRSRAGKGGRLPSPNSVQWVMALSPASAPVRRASGLASNGVCSRVSPLVLTARSARR